MVEMSEKEFKVFLEILKSNLSSGSGYINDKVDNSLYIFSEIKKKIKII